MDKRIIGLLTILLGLAAVSMLQQKGQSDRELYEEWRNTYQFMLRYTPEQDEYRFRIFKKNLQEIN
jgi:hypothetical protein